MIYRLRLLLMTAGTILYLNSFSQQLQFDIALEPLPVKGLTGLQSFAFGQHNGKWLIIGGRRDGLHRRQPFASFDEDGHNRQLLVIDPVSKKYWTAPLTSLPTGLQEQLSSTNMQFFQQGSYLYVAGGYGFSATIDDHTTYAKLAVVDVPATIDAIINERSPAAHFRQISESSFQITGGRIVKLNDILYLVGGQKFLGAYNPMGPDHGPGFIQEYSNQIRKFTLSDDGSTIIIKHLPAITDSNNLHRRDYNVAAQIFPNGREGITAFSGVFQPTIDLPFLNCVNIDSAGYSVNDAFTQYYNHYHCAHFPFYSAAANEMNTVFFGGIAQYYDDAGILTQNNNVPFVKTIARVSRNAEWCMAEYKLPVEMPALLGAGSEFIPNETLPMYANGVIKYDDLSADTSVVGYIYGGISSTAPNIFWDNEGELSRASSNVFRVLLIKNTGHSNHRLNEQSTGTLKVMVYPDTERTALKVEYNLVQSADVTVSLYTGAGKQIVKQHFKNQRIGKNSFFKKIAGIGKGGIYLLTVETSYEKATQKIVVEP